MLYIIATPIGNLLDITLRAIETLKKCDYLLCEDTRHSRILLNYHKIKKPLQSYHKFNEHMRDQAILSDLEAGKEIGLICCAGTPGISDPGVSLIKLCLEYSIQVSVIPGPCALIQALVSSGLDTTKFQFVGFLSKKNKQLKEELIDALKYSGTTICYESPHRLLDTLKLLQDLDPRRLLVVGREYTKKFEEVLRGVAEELLTHWKNQPVRGEIILLIAPSKNALKDEWEDWTIEEHLKWVQEAYKLSSLEAIKLVAKLRKVPKRQIYKEIVNQKNI